MAKAAGRKIYWILWGVLSLGVGGYLCAGLLMKSAAGTPWLQPARTLFLPGKTTHGHYQIELACESCHGDAVRRPRSAAGILRALPRSGAEGRGGQAPAQQIHRPAQRRAGREARRDPVRHLPRRAPPGDHAARWASRSPRDFCAHLPQGHRRGPAEPQGHGVRHLQLGRLPQVPRQSRALRGFSREAPGRARAPAAPAGAGAQLPRCGGRMARLSGRPLPARAPDRRRRARGPHALARGR